MTQAEKIKAAADMTTDELLDAASHAPRSTVRAFECDGEIRHRMQEWEAIMAGIQRAPTRSVNMGLTAERLREMQASRRAGKP